MKIVAVGDTHGRESWKHIVNRETFDTLLFIGDYFDTHENIAPYKQLEVYLDILQYKMDNFDKVVMLIGNHDLHYWKGINQTYSGYQYAMAYSFWDALEKAYKQDALRVSYVWEDYLFSHAGVTKSWMANYELSSLHDMWELFVHRPAAFGFQRNTSFSANPYGDNIWQSPMWVRPKSLKEDAIEGYNQVVGHTQQDKISVENLDKSGGGKLFLIDALGVGEYLVINDGEFEIRKI